jgi:hypothetical protein
LRGRGGWNFTNDNKKNDRQSTTDGNAELATVSAKTKRFDIFFQQFVKTINGRSNDRFGR